MWIVILLLASIFIYGLHYWHLLISTPNESEADPEDEQIDTFYYRAPLWVLIAGITAYILAVELISLF
jgi:hypothetical protein